MTPIEIIALIFAIGILVKLLVISFSPKKWMNVIKPLYNNARLLMVVELILAAIIFYYLLQELSVVQIVGGVLLGALLTGMAFAAYSKEFMPVAEKMIKSRILKKALIPIIIWLVLAVWVLIEIF